MTRDEIIKMAQEVGYPLVSIGGHPYIPPLLAVLLEAVVEAEREACAKVCDRYTHGQWFAKAIRARGET
jgi:hypothetical protein